MSDEPSIEPPVAPPAADPPQAELKNNVPAIIAVCAGLVSCVPALGVVAVGFGVMGLVRARDPRVTPGTRPIAAFGVILGVLGVFWSAMLTGAAMDYYYRRQYAPAIDAQAQFLRLLGSGQINAARGMTDDALDEVLLTEAFAEFERHGALIDLNNNYGGKMHHRADVEVNSELKFERATRLFTGHWTVEPATPQLKAFTFKDAPATRPSP
ncbi:MAG TPA: DUF4190 domain-containing protein [Tepidisphaeraceae bacterium]